MYCSHIQKQLLEFVYGLLDPEDAKEIDDHVGQCVSCQLALLQAQDMSRRLAEAARREFPDVRFQPPVFTRIDPVDDIPAGRDANVWVRWLAAAIVLFVITMLGIPGGLYSMQRDEVLSRQAQLDRLHERSEQLAATYNRDANNVKHQIEQIQTKANKIIQSINDRTNQTQQDIEAIQNAIKMLVEEHKSQQKALATNTGRGERYLIERPSSDGAPSVLRLDLERLKRKKEAAGALKLRVYDSNRELLLEKQTDHRANSQIALPPDLPVEPGAKLTVELTSTGTDKKEETLLDTFTIETPRWHTYVTTDKPVYRPGETVHCCSLTLDRFDFRAIDEKLDLVFTILCPDGKQMVVPAIDWFVDAEGNDVLGPNGKPIRGLSVGTFQLDKQAPEGEYVLRVFDADNRFSPVERSFSVSQYERSRFDKVVHFDKPNYSPGDKVTAMCTLYGGDTREPLSDRAVQVEWQFGNRRFNQSARTDQAGTLKISAVVPAAISGASTLRLDLGQGAELVQTIPVVSSELFVDFYPEGGDLLQGVPNQVYFRVSNNLGQPVHITGKIVDDVGRIVADAVTWRSPEPEFTSGMGTFQFTPEPGRAYFLKLAASKNRLSNNPNLQVKLPPARSDGVVLHADKGVVADNEPFSLQLRSIQRDRHLLVTAFCRGVVLVKKSVYVKAGSLASVELQPADGIGGIFRITVYEKTATGWQPVAERLVYRTPSRRLNLSMRTEMEARQTRLICEATDESNRPSDAILMLSVVEQFVYDRAGDRQLCQLPAYFWLTTSWLHPEEFEYADFLVNDPRWAEPLDLFLGTKGWRRFVHPDDTYAGIVDAAADRASLSSARRQLLDRYATHLASRLKRIEELEFHLKRFRGQQQTQLEQLSKQKQQLEEQVARRRLQFMAEREKLQNEFSQAEAAYEAALAEWHRYHHWMAEMRQILLPLLGLVALLGVFGCLVVGITRRSLPDTVPYFATACCALLAVGVLALSPTASLQDAVEMVQLDDPFVRLRWGPFPIVPEEPGDDKVVVAHLDLPLKNMARPAPGKEAIAEIQSDRRRFAAAKGRGSGPVRSYFLPLPGIADTGKLAGNSADKKVTERAEHKRPQRQDSVDRSPQDLASDVLFWHPVLVTHDGQVTALLPLRAGRYRVLLNGYTPDGRLGSAVRSIDLLPMPKPASR
ncbi:MAG: hypothetical protein KatS3mg105_3555 [Gemmatales bacterium]|nr:MAG: hypothetical protein KatS3mg105_3555 [Gemmatales bacterium]